MSIWYLIAIPTSNSSRDKDLLCRLIRDSLVHNTYTLGCKASYYSYLWLDQSPRGLYTGKPGRKIQHDWTVRKVAYTLCTTHITDHTIPLLSRSESAGSDVFPAINRST